MARKALRAAIEKVVRGAPKCSSTRFTNGGTPATGAHESQRGAYLEERLEGPHVHRLGVGWSLRRTLSATNPIELCLSTVERMARNVKRWRGGDQPLRLPATACAKPRRNSAREGVSGTRNLASRIDRLNPYTLCDMQQSWGRRNQLKPGTTFGVEEFLFVFAIQSFLRIRRPWIEQIRASHNIRRINELDLQKDRKSVV